MAVWVGDKKNVFFTVLFLVEVFDSCYIRVHIENSSQPFLKKCAPQKVPYIYKDIQKG